MDLYQEFIQLKALSFEPTGFAKDLVDSLKFNPILKGHQLAVVKWALRRGRAAGFLDTGLGKGMTQLEIGHWVSQITGNRFLIVTPLAVVDEFQKDADKMGISIITDREFMFDGRTGIYVINYEMIDHYLEAIRRGYFDGVSLDESSILKHFDSKMRNKLISELSSIPYRFSFTATPAPNDYMELGNQAEFLGVMTLNEMLAMFFIHDSGQTSKWRLKGHGQTRFWEWLSAWAVVIGKPSDIGCSDDGYILPGLEVNEIVVPSQFTIEDNQTLSGRIEARRLSIDERVAEAVRLANASDEQWVVWCNLNDESAKLARGIDGAVEVAGSDKRVLKEERLRGFKSADFRVIVTKPSIAGFGLNWQHCSNMVFVGLNDSYEQLYQAIRRLYRFGQTRIVKVWFITSVLEGPVRENILEKERRAKEMMAAMAAHMKEFTSREFGATERETTDYQPSVEMEIPEFMK